MCGEDLRDEGVVERLTRERDEAEVALEKARRWIDATAFSIGVSDDGEPCHATSQVHEAWLRSHLSKSLGVFELKAVGLTVLITSTEAANLIVRAVKDSIDANDQDHDSGATDGQAAANTIGQVEAASVRDEVSSLG